MANLTFPPEQAPNIISPPFSVIESRVQGLLNHAAHAYGPVPQPPLPAPMPGAELPHLMDGHSYFKGVAAGMNDTINKFTQPQTQPPPAPRLHPWDGPHLPDWYRSLLYT
jgi:hypothetical protein